ncbi:MAG: DUF1049 domain-containing protein [Cyanobacteria bacterium P01_D01_bin.36]
MAKFLVVVITAVLSLAIAIFSVQNATPVPITFLRAKTVPLPVGIWVAVALFAGMLGAALLLGLFGKKKSKSL